MGFVWSLLASSSTLTTVDWAGSAWIAGWMVCAAIVAGSFAYEVAKGSGTRLHAVLGGLIRGMVSGMIWPVTLSWWIVSRLTR